MDSYKGWGTQIDLEKTRSNRVLPRTDKELQLPRIIRVQAKSSKHRIMSSDTKPNFFGLSETSYDSIH